MDARRREPLFVSTNFAEAEKVQIAFPEGFRQAVSKVHYVFGLIEHVLLDADIEAAHMQIYLAECASGGLRSAAAGGSATAGEHSAAAERRTRHMLEPIRWR